MVEVLIVEAILKTAMSRYTPMTAGICGSEPASLPLNMVMSRLSMRLESGKNKTRGRCLLVLDQYSLK